MHFKTLLPLAFGVLQSLLVTAAPKPEREPHLLARAGDTLELPLEQGPFGIVSTSDDINWNNLTLTSIHVGAAHNLAQLSPSPPSSWPYYINTTSGYTFSPDGTKQGILRYRLPGRDDIPFHGSLQFNTSSNIAPLYISVVTPLYAFAFDEGGWGERLGINGVFDRWFVCRTLTSYGVKWGVVWKLGEGEIDAGYGCVGIGLRRVKID